MAKLTSIFIALGILKVCLSYETVEVKIDQGVVLGKIEKTVFKKANYYSFRGIPFASAPIKELRFKPPTPHKGWENTLEAFENKPTCMQFSARMRFDEPFGISGSEDCLFISIFTPDLKGDAPIIVFDYNDIFNTGFNGTKKYSPELFVEEGVIVVTVAHRLGLFGYLTTEDEVIPGNNGLRDYIFGLEWVRDNIKNFGGDPNKVTLMGSVGGGALVNMLLYSEKAKGLFSGAIMQSGNAYETLWFYENSREKAFELGEVLEIKTDDSASLLQLLQEVEAQKLLINAIQVISSSPKNNQLGTPFNPVIEHNYSDAVLTALPEKANIVSNVPVIIGFNSREGLDYASHFLFAPDKLTYSVQENMLQFPIRTGFSFDRDSEIFKIARQEIVEFYLGDRILDYSTGIEYSVYAGDVMQGYSLNYAARDLSVRMSSPVFLYMFDFRGQLNENSQFMTRYSRYSNQLWGATVLDELCYLLVCNRIRKDYVDLEKMASVQNERKVLNRMVRMWTNFAKTRNPTPTRDEILKGFSWEPVSEEFNYLHISKKLQMKTDPLGERRQFWDSFLAKYGELAVDGIVKDTEKHDEL